MGLAGAHRAGKTTIATDVAESSAGRIHYHPASVSKLMLERGIDMVAPMTPEVRLGHQTTLLELFCQQLNTAPRPSITDRTPLDMAAYALAEIGMLDSDADLGRQVMEYVQLCLAATRKYFDLIFLVSPLPDYASAAGKPAASLAYQMHVHYLIRALADEVRADVKLVAVKREDRSGRSELVSTVITDRVAGYSKLLTEISIN